VRNNATNESNVIRLINSIVSQTIGWDLELISLMRAKDHVWGKIAYKAYKHNKLPGYLI